MCFFARHKLDSYILLGVSFMDQIMGSEQLSTHSCVPHLRKSISHREESLISKWFIMLSLNLVSIPHSYPRMPDQGDVITSPITNGIF